MSKNSNKQRNTNHTSPSKDKVSSSHPDEGGNWPSKTGNESGDERGNAIQDKK